MNKDFEDFKNKLDDEEHEENVTKYGEQVCTQFAWLQIKKQKENAEKFDKITKNQSKNK